ncbi:LysR family transcriptional regulator [Morganella morganii]
MNYTFRQLSAFITVANTGSFTRAAKLMYLTQGAVSLLIKELEIQTGFTLFDRSSRYVRLSVMGESFLPFATKIVEDYNQAERYVRDQNELRSAVVHIVAAPLIACTLLPEIINAFTLKFPGIRVIPNDEPMAKVQQDVFRGNSELGLGPERELHMDIKKIPFFSAPIHIVCHPNHCFVDREITWQELQKEPVIVVGNESIDFIALSIGRTPPFKVAFIVNHMATALGMAAVGAGVVLAGPFVSTLADGYGLRVVTLKKPVINRKFNIYLSEHRSLTPAAKTFLDFILKFGKKLSTY